MKINLNDKNIDGLTAFHLACKAGNSRIAELLVTSSYEHNIELNSKDIVGYTAFHMACQYGQVEVAQVIIKNSQIKIDLNDKNIEGQTAFHLACKAGNLRVVESLLMSSCEHDLDIDFDLDTQDLYGQTALHLACSYGHSKIVEILIKNYNECEKRYFENYITVGNYCDFNVKDNFGQTSFYLACFNGHKDIVEMLLTKSEDLKLDLRDPKGSPDFAQWVSTVCKNYDLYKDLYLNSLDNSEVIEVLSTTLYSTCSNYKDYTRGLDIDVFIKVGLGNIFLHLI